MPRIGYREKPHRLKPTELISHFFAFRGRKSARWLSVPKKVFDWFATNVTVEKRVVSRGKPVMFVWPGPTRYKRRGDKDELCDYLRGVFGDVLSGMRRTIRHEEVLGLANYLDMTDNDTNQNPNPNRDPTPNPDRQTVTVFATGARRSRDHRRRT